MRVFHPSRVRSRRLLLREELERVQLLSSFTESGYELSYSWSLVFPEAALKGDVRSKIENRSHQIGDWVCRLWYEGLADLHRSGAPLRPFLQAWIDYLMAELERELELFTRSAPQRVNVILLVFMLIPAIFILLSPILFALTQ